MPERINDDCEITRVYVCHKPISLVSKNQARNTCLDFVYQNVLVLNYNAFIVLSDEQLYLFVVQIIEQLFSVILLFALVS